MQEESAALENSCFPLVQGGNLWYNGRKRREEAGDMEEWEALEQACHQCHNCPLANTRTHVVVGVGDRHADVLFVGEGPGENEDLQGEPFVGRAGQLLDEMLSLIGLYRDKNFYITNVVKCRPPQNRNPANEEMKACRGFLDRQIQLLQPKVLICLGRFAAQELIRPDFGITREHGIWSLGEDGIWKIAIFHPSALLRDEFKRPATFQDLRAIREKIREVCPQVYENIEAPF